jgi:hypothetical protein
VAIDYIEGLGGAVVVAMVTGASYTFLTRISSFV